MAGPTCAIFGRGALTESRLVDIDKLLASKSTVLVRTRKGKVWDVEIDERPVHVQIENTEDVLWDCEDELLDAGLLPEDAPFQVVLSAGLNSRVDYDMLKVLSMELAILIGGSATEPTK